MPVGMFWQIQSDFEAFICCRLLFWRLRALAAGLTGARQKQLVQFWLPGRLWAPIIFEAFICCRLLFWRLRALAAGLTGARQKQLVQFWLPGRLWAPINLVNYDYQNVNSLCSRHHYVNSACYFCVSIEL